MRSKSALGTLITASGPSLGGNRLPTNGTTRSHPVHRWFNFIAGFSPEFVQGCFEMRGLGRDDRPVLLDPFSGCGTAPVAARLLGMASHAYEPHPFFALISEAKANSHLYWEELPAIKAAIARGILKRETKGLDASESVRTFLGKMFQEDDLKALQSARLELHHAGFGDNPLAILILSRVLDHCCFAATDGIYKAPTSTKRTISPKAALDKVMGAVIEDEAEAKRSIGQATIHNASSETMSQLDDNSIDLVVTSPPYLNNFDFAEMTRMYLYFWGMASSWGEITDRVRSRLIVNTTTGLKGHKDIQDSYRSTLSRSILEEADKSVKELRIKRSEKAGKKEYDLLVYPYMSQMQSILKECKRVMVSGAPFHMMVSDAALYGVHLPAPQWLAQIMQELGYTNVECEMVRPRGHRWVLDKREGSATGLGEYHVYGRAN